MIFNSSNQPGILKVKTMGDLSIKIERKLKTESADFKKRMRKVQAGVFESTDIDKFRIMSFEYGYRRGFLAAIVERDNHDK